MPTSRRIPVNECAIPVLNNGSTNPAVCGNAAQPGPEEQCKCRCNLPVRISLPGTEESAIPPNNLPILGYFANNCFHCSSGDTSPGGALRPSNAKPTLVRRSLNRNIQIQPSSNT